MRRLLSVKVICIGEARPYQKADAREVASRAPSPGWRAGKATEEKCVRESGGVKQHSRALTGFLEMFLTHRVSGWKYL